METGRSRPLLFRAAGYPAAGDLNGDGKIDLVVEISPANILQAPQDYVQLGNGDGTFQVPTNPLPFSGPVALHDIDGDGKLDLIIQNTYPVRGSPFASVFLGVGDEPSFVSVITCCTWMGVARATSLLRISTMTAYPT